MSQRDDRSDPPPPSLRRTYLLVLGAGVGWIALLWWLTVAFNVPVSPR